MERKGLWYKAYIDICQSWCYSTGMCIAANGTSSLVYADDGAADKRSRVNSAVIRAAICYAVKATQELLKANRDNVFKSVTWPQYFFQNPFS